MSINQNFPNVWPSLVLDFANSRTLDPRITFTRSSIGTYVASNGLIKTAAADEPRFDHDPETAESLGLLIEESRTNLFTNSAFSQITTTSLPTEWSGWNPPTFLTSQTLSPDGVAYGIFHGSVNTNGGGLRRDMTGLTPGGTYYVSYYVKGLTAEELTYFTNNNAIGTTTGTAVGAQDVAWFAATKVILYCSNLNGTGASGTYQTTLTTEWKRFGGVVIADSAGSARIIITNNVGDVGTGDEDGGGTWMIWGAQLELGSFPTSYIPTSGSTVTREPDITKITGTNFSSWYNQNEGTVLVEYDGGRLTSFPSGYGRLATTESWSMEHGNSGTIRYFGVTGGAYNAFTALVDTYTNFSKYAISIENSTYVSAASDGILETSITGAVTYSTTATKMNIGSSPSATYQTNGHIKQLLYYPERLTNDQLQTLTK